MNNTPEHQPHDPPPDAPDTNIDPPADPKHTKPLTCINCRYDLTGLDPTGNCPECNTPIADTRAPDKLTEASPKHLAALQRGATLVALGAALLAAASIPFYLHHKQLGSGPNLYSPPSLWVSTSTTVIAGSTVSFIGWLPLTRPNQRRYRKSRRSPLRITTRIICPLAHAVTALLTAIAALVWLTDTNTGADYPAPAISGTIAGAFSIISAALAFIPAQLHITSLAKRLDAPKLERRSRTYALVVPITLIFLPAITRGLTLLVIPAILALITLETTTSLLLALTKLRRQWNP